MPWWLWLLDAVGAVLLLVVLAGVGLVVRRRFLERRGGTFELGLRALGPEQGSSEGGSERGVAGWVLGLGRYRDDSLEWFRIFSPRPTPTIVWRRHELVVLEQRDPERAERHALYGGHVVVRCQTPDGDLELALSARALTGLSSWLEAGPPGSQRSA